MRLVALLAAAAILGRVATALSADVPVPVTPDNFPRAESDLHLSGIVKDAGLGKFRRQRKPAPPDRQTAARMDRDTFVSEAVFDLDAGPVTITLPDAGPRFVSLQIVDEDGYTTEVDYGPGTRTLTKDRLGTRYVLAVMRVFVDASDPKDVEAANAWQDAVRVDQPGGPGAFQIPNWDAPSQVDVRTGLRVLAETLTDSKGMFGPKGKVDPVRRLIGTALAWGGLPEADTLILERAPERNDGRTVYRLVVKDVPVEGWWSISVYNDRGFYDSNQHNAYTVNSVTAKTGPDGSVAVQFGGCDGAVPNCLPTPPDWSFVARLYRPRAAALDGSWVFPEPKAIPQPPAEASPPKVAPALSPEAKPAKPLAAPATGAGPGKPAGSAAPGKKIR